MSCNFAFQRKFLSKCNAPVKIFLILNYIAFDCALLQNSVMFDIYVA